MLLKLTEAINGKPILIPLYKVDFIEPCTLTNTPSAKSVFTIFNGDSTRHVYITETLEEIEKQWLEKLTESKRDI